MARALRFGPRPLLVPKEHGVRRMAGHPGNLSQRQRQEPELCGLKLVWFNSQGSHVHMN